MKLQKYILWLLLAPALFMAGCKKETTDNVSATAKVSFPEITLNGPVMVISATGANYVDAGAKLKDDITGVVTDIQPTSSDVNTAVPGLYNVTFTAANANGFVPVYWGCWLFPNRDIITAPEIYYRYWLKQKS